MCFTRASTWPVHAALPGVRAHLFVVLLEVSSCSFSPGMAHDGIVWAVFLSMVVSFFSSYLSPPLKVYLNSLFILIFEFQLLFF